MPDPLIAEHLVLPPRRRGQPALIDAIHFPRAPDDIVLEQNDGCFHFESDFEPHIDRDRLGPLLLDESILNGIAARGVFIGDIGAVISICGGLAGHGMPRCIRHGVRSPRVDCLWPAGQEGGRCTGRVEQVLVAPSAPIRIRRCSKPAAQLSRTGLPAGFLVSLTVGAAADGLSR